MQSSFIALIKSDVCKCHKEKPIAMKNRKMKEQVQIVQMQQKYQVLPNLYTYPLASGCVQRNVLDIKYH